MSESMQHELDRDNKPRVHITYDVESGGATKKRELPFVVGVLADLTGDNREKLEPFRKRVFEQIDRKNFDEFLRKQKPRVTFKVDNELTDDKDKLLGVDIEFESMADFDPDRIVEKVPELRLLLEERQRLKSLQSHLTTSEELTAYIEELRKDEARCRALAQVLGIAIDGQPEKK